MKQNKFFDSIRKNWISKILSLICAIFIFVFLQFNSMENNYLNVLSRIDLVINKLKVFLQFLMVFLQVHLVPFFLRNDLKCVSQILQNELQIPNHEHKAHSFIKEFLSFVQVRKFQQKIWKMLNRIKLQLMKNYRWRSFVIVSNSCWGMFPPLSTVNPKCCS